MTKYQLDTAVKRAYRSTAALVAAVPAVVGAISRDANTARTVTEVVASVVVVADAALYIAQRYFGFGLDVTPIPTPAAPVPAPVAAEIAKVETVAAAVAPIEQATEGTPKA